MDLSTTKMSVRVSGESILKNSKNVKCQPSCKMVKIVSPGVLYLFVQLIAIILYWVMCQQSGRKFSMEPWDAGWYLKIAEKGYFQASTGQLDAQNFVSDDSAMAFFPGFPILVRAISPLFGRDFLVAGVGVSLIFGIAGAYGIMRLVKMCGGNRRAGLLAIALTAAAPMSIVYSLPYPESLLTALIVFTLISVLEERWLVALSLTLVAGLVKPMAAPLIALVMLAACVNAYTKRPNIGNISAAVLAPLGMVSYFVWVNQVSSVPGGYFSITAAGWDNRLDFGKSSVRWLRETLLTGHEVYMVATAILIFGIIGLLAALITKMSWEAWILAAFSIALILAHSGQFQGRMRLMLAAFPLLVALAMHLELRSPRVIATVTIPFMAIGLWLSAHGLAVWQYSM